jgi:hypothetical protein
MATGADPGRRVGTFADTAASSRPAADQATAVGNRMSGRYERRWARAVWRRPVPGGSRRARRVVCRGDFKSINRTIVPARPQRSAAHCSADESEPDLVAPMKAARSWQWPAGCCTSADASCHGTKTISLDNNLLVYAGFCADVSFGGGYSIGCQTVDEFLENGPLSQQVPEKLVEEICTDLSRSHRVAPAAGSPLDPCARTCQGRQRNG